MTRTLKDIERDLELAQKELKPIQEARDAAVEKANKFYYEREKYIIDNGLYYPITELSNYIGKEISYIKLVKKNEDGILNMECFYGDDILEVDDNGHLWYSSQTGGVMNFDNKTGKYVMYFHFNKIEFDFVGFLELKFMDEE